MATPNQAPDTTRTEVRDRHHARAKAVAEGKTPQGPDHIMAILLEDPAFQNLVAVYRKALETETFSGLSL